MTWGISFDRALIIISQSSSYKAKTWVLQSMVTDTQHGLRWRSSRQRRNRTSTGKEGRQQEQGGRTRSKSRGRACRIVRTPVARACRAGWSWSASCAHRFRRQRHARWLTSACAKTSLTPSHDPSIDQHRQTLFPRHCNIMILWLWHFLRALFSQKIFLLRHPKNKRKTSLGHHGFGL